MNTENPQNRYAARGASSGKEEVHAAIKRVDAGLYPRAFCKILPDYSTGDEAFCALMHADGAGTKAALAWALWRETGDLSVWRGIAQDAIVMNTDDLLCVGCTGPMLLSSTIGRNKRLVPGKVIAALISGAEEVLQQLADFGLNIRSCGGETADLGDVVRTLVVDSTLYARMPRANVVDNGRIKPGLAIVALASYGQASYESVYNSGIGSNGLTSARHELLGPGMLPAYADTVEPGTPAHLAYNGPYRMTDKLPGTPLTVAQALLSPTRTYAPIIVAALKAHHRAIYGMVHCTGGGQAKALRFIGNCAAVKDSLLPIPLIFIEIALASGTSWQEMYQVFNMGHRMELYVEPAAANDIIAIAKTHNIEAAIIGHTEPSDKPVVRIQGPEGMLTYTL